MGRLSSKKNLEEREQWEEEELKGPPNRKARRLHLQPEGAALTKPGDGDPSLPQFMGRIKSVGKKFSFLSCTEMPGHGRSGDVSVHTSRRKMLSLFIIFSLSLSLHSNPHPPNPPHYYHNKLFQLSSPNTNNILYTLLLYIFKIFLLKKKILGRRRLLAGA